MPNDIKQILLRVDSNTHEKLKALAAANKRSMNGQILFVLEAYIRQRTAKDQASS